MMAPEPGNSPIVNGVRVSHTAETFRRYPGEEVVLFTRAEVGRSVSDFQVKITLPPGLKFKKFQAETLPQDDAVPLFGYDETGTLALIWNLENPVGSSVRYDFCVTAVVAPTLVDRMIESVATLVAGQDEDSLQSADWVTIAIKAKGAYLKHLPSIYQDDELMGRLLMLFESFLKPIEQRVAHMPDFLDARLTPTELMPWLASWTGLVLDSDLSEQQRRRLLWYAVSLYGRRGTRQELQDYLEIITGGSVDVDDSAGFHLGAQTLLGLGTAFGHGNPPHIFHVTVHMPGNPGQQERAALERRVRMVIETEKPAHTGYRLEIRFQEGQAVSA
jgi:phage tail-like protein